MTPVDVVVVSYNSAETLRACVAALAGKANITVYVVDNASSDGSVAAVAGLDLEVLALRVNGGFAHGCNEGWRAGSSPFVLFLNPDARIEAEALGRLTDALEVEQQPTAGLVAPRIVDEHGTLDYSQRRFPRLRSTYAQAFFLHRLFPHADWTDELIRDHAAYERPASPDWVSGACVLCRRTVLEAIGGWDEGFFLYCEDIDLCKRIRLAGYDVLYEPGVTVVHVGGASAPRAGLAPVLAASRIRYARRHRSRPFAAAERSGVAIGALTHAALTTKGHEARSGHISAFRTALGAELGRF